MIQRKKNASAKSYPNCLSRLLDDLTLEGMQNVITDLLIRNRESYYFKNNF
jgi:hypothetical protein